MYEWIDLLIYLILKWMDPLPPNTKSPEIHFQAERCFLIIYLIFLWIKKILTYIESWNIVLECQNLNPSQFADPYQIISPSGWRFDGVVYCLQPMAARSLLRIVGARPSSGTALLLHLLSGEIHAVKTNYPVYKQ